MKIAIIGAGPAGLTAAYELAKKDSSITLHIYEASSAVGGMCRSMELWNSTVDIGPHRFFSYDKRVNQLWLEIVDKDYKMVNRTTRIYFRNKFFAYPIKPLNAFGNIGLLDALSSVLSYCKEKIFPTPLDNSFEAWVKNRFGNKLFELFFKTYSEKLWGIPCRQLDADFAAQRIKKLSLTEVLMNTFSLQKKNSHKTLIDQFAYPIKGTGMVYTKMLQKTLSKNPNHKFFSNTKIKGCIVENNVVKGIQLTDNSIEHYDAVVSTMPLTALFNSIEAAPREFMKFSNALTYRNTIIVYLKVNNDSLFPDNWLYIHSPELNLGRITNFRNWVPELYGENKFTILALEYWCNEDDAFWNKADDQLIAMAKDEIVKTNLVKITEIEDAFVYKIPKCYPVYALGYKDKLKPIIDYLSTIKNLYPIGRYGSFKYNNQDHSMLMGILTAENIVDNANHNLWNINTDYEVYQENTIITETGLTNH